MSSPEPTVGQYMTAEPATADAGLRLSDAQERMGLDNIRHLVVLYAGQVAGMLSSRDIAMALSMPGSNREKLLVQDAMADQPYVCTSNTPISEVAREMEANRYGAAIVVDGDEVVGVFTTTDALRALRELATGQRAEHATSANHLPPTERQPPRRFHIRKHRPIDTHGSGMFKTS